MTIEDVARQFTDIPENRPGLFDEMAGTVFAFQRRHCSVYSRYCNEIDTSPHPEAGPEPHASVYRPFLPVDAFRHIPVTTFPSDEAEVVFESSGTGRGRRSKHYVRNRRIYERSVEVHFRLVFGDGPFLIVAHLPEYAEESSLVYMIRHLIETFGAQGSAFFLGNDDWLEQALSRTTEGRTRLLVFGAAFGLIDLLARRQHHLPESSLVVETGGMKTHRREISRKALHDRLAEGFGVDRTQVWSEYGMCELMSQCYTRGGETFFPPPWMRFAIVDPFDPFVGVPMGTSGALALTDLANLYSCSYLLTGDRAIQDGHGFQVLGRLTGAELRGCNFLLEDAGPP